MTAASCGSKSARWRGGAAVAAWPPPPRERRRPPGGEGLQPTLPTLLPTQALHPPAKAPPLMTANMRGAAAGDCCVGCRPRRLDCPRLPSIPLPLPSAAALYSVWCAGLQDECTAAAHAPAACYPRHPTHRPPARPRSARAPAACGSCATRGSRHAVGHDKHRNLDLYIWRRPIARSHFSDARRCHRRSRLGPYQVSLGRACMGSAPRVRRSERPCDA